jgi:hypothetical protein
MEAIFPIHASKNTTGHLVLNLNLVFSLKNLTDTML